MKNGQPWAAFGTPGGHTITQNVAQIAINLIDFNMNMQEAIDAPKLAFFDEDSAVCTEKGIPKSVVSSLEKMGHNIDNDNITSYIGLNGEIGNAMGVKMLYNSNGSVAFDVGVDKRKEAWSRMYDSVSTSR